MVALRDQSHFITTGTASETNPVTISAQCRQQTQIQSLKTQPDQTEKCFQKAHLHLLAGEAVAEADETPPDKTTRVRTNTKTLLPITAALKKKVPNSPRTSQK